MTAPDDLIRRDTAERAIRARQRDTEDSGIYAGLSVALQELADLPADPVAEAERAVSASAHAWQDDLTREPWDYDLACLSCGSSIRHSDGCRWAKFIDALNRYRAAVAARSAGTVPPAPAPAPSSGCHNDKPGDPCPCGANFERCPPAGTPPNGIVDDAPACARCGGSGEVIAARSSWTQPDDDDREPEPCPECRGKP